MSLPKTDNSDFNDIECFESQLNSHLDDLNIECHNDKPNNDLFTNSNEYTSEFDIFSKENNSPFDGEEFDNDTFCNQYAYSDVNTSDKPGNKEDLEIESQACKLDDSCYWNQSGYSNDNSCDNRGNNDEFEAENQASSLAKEIDDDSYWNRGAHSNVNPSDKCEKNEEFETKEQVFKLEKEIDDNIYWNQSAPSNENPSEKFENNEVFDIEERACKNENDIDNDVYYNQSEKYGLNKEFDIEERACKNENDIDNDAYYNQSEKYGLNKEIAKEEPICHIEDNENQIGDDSKCSEAIIKTDSYDMEIQLKEDNVIEKVDDNEITRVNTTFHNKEVTESPKDLIVTIEKPKVFKRFENQAFAGSRCVVCEKTVYPMEKLMMDSLCYHKQCFKCGQCGKILSPTAASKFNGNIFCKHHYIELFRKRGRYDDICVSGENRNDTIRSSVSSPISDNKFNYCGNLKKKSVSDYHCVSGDLPSGDRKSTEKKVVIDIETSNRVANTRRAWEEGRLFAKPELKRDDNNNNNSCTTRERRSSSVSGKIREIAAIFESSH